MQLHEKIHKLKDHVTLDPIRKAELKGALLLAALRDAEVVRHSGVSRIFTNYFKPMPIFASFIVLALLGGGASAAAQTATPGDVLYPVKVHVNEKVATALAVNTEAKANVAAKIAEHRLNEATELAAQGTLSPEVKAKLEASFEKHAERVDEKIAKLHEEGKDIAAANAASRFEASLKAHQDVLMRLNVHASSSGFVHVLGAKVGTELNHVMKLRGSIESELKSSTSTPKNSERAAEARIKAALHNIASSEKFVAAKKAEFGADATVAAEAKLVVANKLAADAQAKLDTDLFTEAFLLAGDAHRAAQDARHLVRVQVRIQGDDDKDDDVESNSSSSDRMRDHLRSELKLDHREDFDKKLDALLDLGL